MWWAVDLTVESITGLTPMQAQDAVLPATRSREPSGARLPAERREQQRKPGHIGDRDQPALAEPFGGRASTGIDPADRDAR